MKLSIKHTLLSFHIIIIFPFLCQKMSEIFTEMVIFYSLKNKQTYGDHTEWKTGQRLSVRNANVSVHPRNT